MLEIDQVGLVMAIRQFLDKLLVVNWEKGYFRAACGNWVTGDSRTDGVMLGRRTNSIILAICAQWQLGVGGS